MKKGEYERMNDYHFDKILGEIIFDKDGSKRTNIMIARGCLKASEDFAKEAAFQDGSSWGHGLSLQSDRFRLVASQYALLDLTEREAVYA